VKLLVVGEKMRVRESQYDYVTRRLYFALGRFAPQIASVTACLGDCNGPRGGVDKRCRIVVKLRRLESVLREAHADALEAAVSAAAESAGRGVARALERRRRTTRRPGLSMAGSREPSLNGNRLKPPNTAAIEPEES
jgi:putative sigma-54 modulation protein